MISQEFSELELSIIFQALNNITIQGKDAKNVSNLIDKILEGLTYIKGLKLEEERKKFESLEQIKTSSKK
jgi:VIT1/CCC1 family predicted Fe2+/Mn2+ transporter